MPATANVMLALFQKRTEKVQLNTPIWQYIASKEGDAAANAAFDDLGLLDTLREDIRSQAGTTQAQIETLSKYFRALKALEVRIPISKEKGHVHVMFPWYDAFRGNKRMQQMNLHFEKAAVLFNVAAVLSQQALNCNRATADGLKAACVNFSEAAGAFEHLRAVVGLKVDPPRPVDVSPECCLMLERLMLAQASECVYEKVCIDGRSTGLLARLALHTSIAYRETHRVFDDPLLSQHFDRNWVAHSHAKAVIYQAESLLQAAAEHSSRDEVGEQLSRLREASVLLESATKEVSTTSADLQRQYNRIKDKAQSQLKKTESLNNSVYLARVPAPEDLPAVQPLSMVKSAFLASLTTAPAKEAWFAELVPEASAKVLSKYTDMVDDLGREILGVVETATDEARLRLKEMELPDMLNALEPGHASVLPEGLRKDLEALESQGGVLAITELQKLIGELRAESETMLVAAEGLLDEEGKEDDALRSHHGSSWKRPTSSALAAHLRERIAVYRSNLTEAGKSDAKVHAKLAQYSESFKLLTVEGARARMPPLQAPLMSTGDVEPATVVANLRAGMEQLSQMAAERASLEERMRETRNSENVLSKLLSGMSPSEELFEQELKKYQPFRAAAQENAAKQRELLEVVTKYNGLFRKMYGLEEWRVNCTKAAKDIRMQTDTFREILDNYSEGHRFYTSLLEAIKQLHQQCGDFVMTRRIERDEMATDIQHRQEVEKNELAAKALAEEEMRALQAKAAAATPQPVSTDDKPAVNSHPVDGAAAPAGVPVAPPAAYPMPHQPAYQPYQGQPYQQPGYMPPPPPGGQPYMYQPPPPPAAAASGAPPPHGHHAAPPAPGQPSPYPVPPYGSPYYPGPPHAYPGYQHPPPYGHAPPPPPQGPNSGQ